MPNSHEFIVDVNRLLAKLDESGDFNTGIEVANQVVRLLGTHDTKEADLVVDEQVLQLPNAERYDRWFHSHPWMGGERAAFELTDAKDIPIQAKFYWLQKRSRQFIAGSVHFTENWEDADYTRNDNFKVGIDFFLTPNGRSLIVALSNRGNIRVVELQHKLNNTQVEIFTKWRDAIQISSTEALHTTLWESFKLQSVNKDFYTGVANSFTELLQHLKSIGRDEEDAKLFASRLLGRLLFVWFLRKKDIIDESLGYFEASNDSATNYYKRSLERLFFNTLNTPIDDRDEFKKEFQKSLFPESDNEPQAKLFQVDNKTPYLNGGLFEPHDNDWYKDSSLTFPEGFFTNLYNHFDQFNFTTDESSPEYEQVAIDPEMLGRVFESLLATQVDETGQQARKAKGAFYTPREIVSYMCRESLRNYLYATKQDDERYKKAVDELLDRSDHEWAGAGTNSRRDAVPKEYRTVIVDALDTVTVLDPACGSGAFPMGMLQLLIKTYERLEGRFDPYKTKLQIVQNNIFGVDIEPMAVEISRLRAWLSLIVDEEDSSKVDALPNLDFKFITANSLIKPDKQFGLGEDKKARARDSIVKIIREYFKATDKATKSNLKAQFNKQYAVLAQKTLFGDESKAQQQIATYMPFDTHNVSSFFDPSLMFGKYSNDKFDIVIGNPPYIQLQKNGGELANIYQAEAYKTFTRTGDIYSLFYERGLELTKKSTGLLCYITSNKWMKAGYGEKTRYYFTQQNPIVLIDFGGFKVFESATVDTSILLIQNTANKRQLLASHFKNDYRKEQSIEEYFKANSSKMTELSSSTWFIGNNAELALKSKIHGMGTPLKNWGLRIYRGVLTGCNEAFIIDEATKNRLIAKEPKSQNIIKPLLRGRDLKRYGFSSDRYILATGYDMDIKSLYPAVYEYIKVVGDKIKADPKNKSKGVYDRSDQGKDWWNLRACDYYDEFQHEKIMWPETMRVHRGGDPNFPRFNLKPTNTYIDKTVFMMDYPRPLFFLGLINSKLGWKIIDNYVDRLDKGGYMMQKAMVENLPIPNPEDLPNKTIQQIEQYVQQAISRRKTDASADISDIEARINNLVYELYNLNPEEILLVESSGS